MHTYVRTQDHRCQDSNHQPIKSKITIALCANHLTTSDSQQQQTIQGYYDCEDSNYYKVKENRICACAQLGISLVLILYLLIYFGTF